MRTAGPLSPGRLETKMWLLSLAAGLAFGARIGLFIHPLVELP